MAITREDLRDLDLAWLGVDSLGQVAVFTTGGEGPIASSALGTLEEAEAAVLALPEISTCELHSDASRPDSFVAFAKRGLFAYDWADVHRTHAGASHEYELQARPRRPIALSELPESVRSIAASTSIKGVKFGASSVPGAVIAV